MQERYNVIRCPRCSGVHLNAVYDNTRAKKMGRSFAWFGFLGLAASAVKNRNMQETFWQCTECGCLFPMEK